MMNDEQKTPGRLFLPFIIHHSAFIIAFTSH